MPRKLTGHDVRLVVTPVVDKYRFQDWTDEKWVQEKLKAARNICDELEAQIRRHCDGFASITLEVIPEAVCEFCGYTWTEESKKCNGGCCDDDMKHDTSADQ